MLLFNIDVSTNRFQSSFYRKYVLKSFQFENLFIHFKEYIKINILRAFRKCTINTTDVFIMLRSWQPCCQNSLRTELVTRKKIAYLGSKIKVKNYITNYQPFTKCLFFLSITLYIVHCFSYDTQQIFE